VGSGAASGRSRGRFDSPCQLSAVDRLLLDTTVLIDLSKNFGDVLTALNALVASGGILGVCAISVAEFLAGVPVPQRGRWERWIADFEYWDISREAAVLAGVFRFDLALQGRTLQIPDVLMAATAVVTGSILVTNNIKDYPMPNLRLLRLGS
jgi:predicted nucleic acid-binding protein